MTSVFSRQDIQDHGLNFAQVVKGRKGPDALEKTFRAHYGSSALVLSYQWEDLCNNDDLPLTESEKSEKGLKRFLMAHFWLWAKPRNASIFSSRFKICEDYCCGKPFWIWIERIASLSKKKIVFDAELLAPDAATFGFSIDGVDFPMVELAHERFPRDSSAMSHKMKCYAAKYLILLSVAKQKCLQIVGPEKGGVADTTMLQRSGILEKLHAAGKLCNVDLGFRMKDKTYQDSLAYPDYMDEKELHEFKSRSRLRQETYNARLKYFRSLSEHFEYGMDKHKIVLCAVAATVQYHLELGSPLFDV